ncbi:MAG: ATP-binding protein [Betaproteobacteria bacterium]|nr:ATP-binding protein [Betaproteobacteria bacterium]MDH4323996.1 ATP-binding protein [Betaproteobacteria bacterium]MDH5577950.1 ATP-binding protein [Betaproteobacteria bacterium]
MNYDRAAQFLARLDQLRPMQRFLEQFCTESGLPRAAYLRLNLVVEELFTNTVKHGHRGDSDAPVWIAVSRGGDRLSVVYEDKAPPFNPYARLSEPVVDTTLSMRKIGGLGVLLTKELAASRDYAYIFGRNRIRLTLATT